jgi:cytochrome c oxidase assembly protein subunit 15
MPALRVFSSRHIVFPFAVSFMVVSQALSDRFLRGRAAPHWLALLLASATLVLLAAGALVVGTGSSLAVPDWPLAYGQFFPPMVGGILYEHGHRLIASTVGLLTIMLAAWLWFGDTRRWVGGLAVAALGLVVVQGLLGGITVLFLLPKAVSIAHALLAQLFFATVAILAEVTAPGWAHGVAASKAGAMKAAAALGVTRRVALAAFLAILAAILLGAVVRHFNAGLVIPDFPLVFGGLVPSAWSFQILVHYLHRLAALLSVGLVGFALWHARRTHPGNARLGRPAWALLALVALQMALGAGVIWTQRELITTTAHLVNGALLLGAAGLLTVRAWAIEAPFAPGHAGRGDTR